MNRTAELGRVMGNQCDPVFSRVDDLISLLNKSKFLHILYILNAENKVLRFSEIKKLVRTSSTTLSRRLNELERNGLVEKSTVLKRTSSFAYCLTTDAKQLAPTIQSMYDWVEQSKFGIES